MANEGTTRGWSRRFGVVALCCAGCASPGEPVPVGSWLHRGARHIRGSGQNVMLEITVGEDGPSVRRTLTQFPDKGHGEVVTFTGGPEPVRVDGCWLRCGAEGPATFRLEGDRLVFPGLAEESPGTWIYGTDGPAGQVLRWSCAADPRRVPTGAASFPSVQRPGALPQRYVATADPVTGDLVRLDFFDADNASPGTTFLFEASWGVGVLKTWPLDVWQRYFVARPPR